MKVKKIIFKILRFSGLPYLTRQLIQRDKITILLFHDMNQEKAERIFHYLRNRYNLISFEQYLEARFTGKKLPAKALVITFDDGHISNYSLLPMVISHAIPITIFLCAAIVGTNRHFWFNYNKLPLPPEDLKKLPNKKMLDLLAKNEFDQEMEHNTPQALQKDQITSMAPYINLQAHALFHPIFPRLPYEEAKTEIFDAKKILEKDYGLNINALAYPNGDYSERDVQLAKDAGYRCALTVDFGYNTMKTDIFRLKRIALNDDCNTDELAVKASGLWGFLKTRTGKMRYNGLSQNIDDQ